MSMTPKDVVAMAKEKGAKLVDYKFIDLPGIWQHKTVPISEFDESVFAEGHGFDGSSIRGFQGIEESDMLLIPDPNTAIVDPFMKEPTLSLICNVVSPDMENYSRDARYVAQKAEAYLNATGIADASYWGPEAEFFIFDDVRYDLSQNAAYYSVDSEEAIWNTGKNEGPNLGYKIRNKEGYLPVPPADATHDIRSEMTLVLESLGIPVEAHHHEVATGGQGEIGMRFDTLTNMADKTMTFKYVVKNVARRYGKLATFMPKPLFGDNGSGMHVHQSLWLGGQPLFFDEKNYAQLSQTALYYIGGLLKHASALLALTSPTTNSYKRLVPGYEAPVNIAFSARNRSAAVRIPMYSKNPKTKRIEFRPPDASSNPYLALAAMLMAGIDGIKNKIDPVAEGFGPMQVNIYELPPEEKAKVKSVPGSLEGALKALEEDHAFLLEGGVFTKDLLETWISYKYANEVDSVRLRPHPMEFKLYFDI
ncbi:glutamine synthetase glycine-rich site [Lucifera butyrica]|uniref:Glutamine synthetase n=1 Tax=Lucifera butyrica TaxID=1351585 RepID=A0A498RB09_9FIRM|nr:type I glutamate--ammonia ligase [Lucifera butyrica]VBB06298.1 glutamine synthetase glycine-rich site [Lucifera butyrica]